MERFTNSAMFSRSTTALGLAAILASSGALSGHAQESTPAKPRAARSVHLSYPAPEGNVYYNEMTVEATTPGSYFMACGWDTGYFGIQQLTRSDEKVVLFSVWDPTHGDDPNAVKTEDRVEVLYEGEGVRVRRFGGEGTGGQCMATCTWAVGETNKFVIASEAQGDKTAYTAWVWLTSKSTWWKLATFRTRTGGRPLRGYHSFVEDFRRDFKSVGDLRRASYANGWVRTTGGEWVALTKARFTASSAEWESKDNIDAGVANGRFYMATGGDISASTPLRGTISLPSTPGKPPVLDFLSASTSAVSTQTGSDWHPRKGLMWGTLGVKGSVLEKFQALKAAGFDGVEMNSHMNREEVLAAKAATGLHIPSVCLATHWSKPLSDPDPSVRAEGLAGLEVALRDAAAYGASSVLLVPGIVNAKVSYQECWDRSTAEIRKVLPLARELGVKIAIENVWNNFLLSPLEAARYVDQFESPYLGWHFDAGNIVLYGWPEQWIRILGHRILKIHLKEFSRKKCDEEGRWKGFAVNFLEGDNNWPEVIKAAREIGYTDWFITEQGGANSPEGLQDMVQRVDKILGM